MREKIIMKISEALNEELLTLTEGDYLVAHTAPAGYFPDIHGTDEIHTGRYIYKIKTEGSGLKVVPVVATEDGKSYEDDDNNPIVVQEDDKVTYMTGTNHPYYRDVYHSNGYRVIKDIPVGKEAYNILLAFVEFTNSEFSLGVNDFNIESPEFLDETPDPLP